MRRALLSLVILVAPVLSVLATTGCEPEIKTVHSETTIQETEPQMTSPGDEVLE
jgi:hypothetical protein